jgi:hypothetical protein
MILTLVQPFDSYWPLFFKELSGKSDITLVWIVLFGTCSVGAALAERRFRIFEWHDGAPCIVLVVATSGLALILFGDTSSLGGALSFVVLHELGRGLWLPLLDNYVQEYLDSDNRATFGAVRGLLSQIFKAIFMFFVWLYASNLPNDNLMVLSLWTISGTLILALAVVLWLMHPKKDANPTL